MDPSLLHVSRPVSPPPIGSLPSSCSSSPMSRTPMSERQQLALLKRMENKQQQQLNKKTQDYPAASLVSPPRAPLSVVSHLSNTPSSSHPMQTGSAASSAASSPSTSLMSAASSPATPKTPIDDKLRRKVMRRNPKGETALHKAAYRGDRAQVLELLEAGGDPNVVDNAGWTPLHEACNKGHVGVVRLLVENGADLNMVGGVSDAKLSVLHDACRNGHLKVVKYLVAHGARTDCKDSAGDTPLEAARKLAQQHAGSHNWELKRVARFLEEVKANPGLLIDADPCSSDEDEQTPSQKYLENQKQLKPRLGSNANKANVFTSNKKQLNFFAIDVGKSNKTMDDKKKEETTASTATTTVAAVSSAAAAGTITTTAVTSSTVMTSTSSGAPGQKKEEASATGSDIKGSADKKDSNFGAKKDSGMSESDMKGSAQISSGEKRSHDDDDSEESKRKRRKEEDKKEGAAGGSLKGGRGSRGNSTDKSTGASKSGSGGKSGKRSPTSSHPNSAANSPRSRQPAQGAGGDGSDSDGGNSTNSGGLKVPPLKIVLSGGNGGEQEKTSPKGESSSAAGADANSGDDKASGDATDASKDKDSVMNEINNDRISNTIGGSRMTRSRANQGTPGPEGSSSNADSGSGASNSNVNENSAAQDSVSVVNSSTSYTDYHVKKRKLRSQVDENGAGSSNANQNGAGSGGNNSSNNTNGGSQALLNRLNEPQNDIEKFLKLRRQIELRWKNIFPVQPKPPQGFRDYLLNRKTYLLQGNANERLRSIPRIQPPPSLDGPLKALFVQQENNRYNLRKKHLVEKEKLVLSVEQEILRVHGRAARALANQSLPFSFCTYIRDEEIYTPIDPQQEEKNRDIRSRYDGRLFLSWLQDVDDKWEKIKEQMVLRHHNEAESLNAVQKMDWEWKLNELSGKASSDTVSPQIDDLYIPMVQVSDDFDLQEGR